MIFFKILQEFLLPSVFVFVLILIGIILVFRKKRGKLGKILIILGILFYYLFSITPVADLTLLPLESQYIQIEENELGKTDKIVLLLGGREGDVLRASEILRIFNFQLSIVDELRSSSPSFLLSKNSVFNEFPNPNFQIIISGKDPLNPQRKEAEEVKEFLAERGIPAENIILEDKSKTTKESAQNLKELLDKEPFFLVTSAYHMPRSIEVFQKMGMNPFAAPTDFKREKSYSLLDFFPDAQNLRKSDLAFHEYFGILFYRFFVLQ